MSLKPNIWQILLILMMLLIGSCHPTTENDRSASTASSNLKENIESLPYFNWSPARETIRKKAVTIYDKERAYPGLNIYNSRDRAQAHLMDMSGQIRHSWSSRSKRWNHIELCPNGDLLVIVKDTQLLRFDWNSNLLWSKELACHHDLDLADNGDIYVIVAKEKRIFPALGPIRDDYVVVLNSEGTVKQEISLYQILKDEIPYNLEHRLRDRKKIQEKRDKPLDVFHCNTVEIVTHSVKPLFQKGSLLLSLRELDLIAVIDPKQQSLVWKFGRGVLRRQHHPTLLPDNHLLIFDNWDLRRGSRVVELNPVSQEIVWKYATPDPKDFFSAIRGANQRLPNGNTLITESDRGRVFEVTTSGEIVWEFFNPDLSGDKRGIIYRMMRITEPEKYPCLKALP